MQEISDLFKKEDARAYVNMVGDINGDGKVDMRDVGYVARRFMCLPSDPLWDPVADINGDVRIDMIDISTVARHFGEHYHSHFGFLLGYLFPFLSV